MRRPPRRERSGRDERGRDDRPRPVRQPGPGRPGRRGRGPHRAPAVDRRERRAGTGRRRRRPRRRGEPLGAIGRRPARGRAGTTGTAAAADRRPPGGATVGAGRRRAGRGASGPSAAASRPSRSRRRSVQAQPSARGRHAGAERPPSCEAAAARQRASAGPAPRLKDAGPGVRARALRRGPHASCSRWPSRRPRRRRSASCSASPTTGWASGSDAVRELEAFRDLTGSTEQHPVLADCYRASSGTRRGRGAVGGAAGGVAVAPTSWPRGASCMAGSLADRGSWPRPSPLLEKSRRTSSSPQVHHLRLAYALADLYERAGDVPGPGSCSAWVGGSASPDFADAAERASAARLTRPGRCQHPVGRSCTSIGALPAPHVARRLAPSAAAVSTRRHHLETSMNVVVLVGHAVAARPSSATCRRATGSWPSRSPSGRGRAPAESVPVAWFDPPDRGAAAGPPAPRSWSPAQVRRRFFRTPAGTESRTEVVADRRGPGHAAQAGRAAALEALAVRRALTAGAARAAGGWAAASGVGQDGAIERRPGWYLSDEPGAARARSATARASSPPSTRAAAARRRR